MKYLEITKSIVKNYHVIKNHKPITIWGDQQYDAQNQIRKIIWKLQWCWLKVLPFILQTGPDLLLLIDWQEDYKYCRLNIWDTSTTKKVLHHMLPVHRCNTLSQYHISYYSVFVKVFSIHKATGALQ